MAEVRPSTVIVFWWKIVPAGAQRTCTPLELSEVKAGWLKELS